MGRFGEGGGEKEKGRHGKVDSAGKESDCRLAHE